MPSDLRRALLTRVLAGTALGLADAGWTLATSPYGGVTATRVLLACMGCWCALALLVAPTSRKREEFLPALAVLAGLVSLLAFLPLPGLGMRICAVLLATAIASLRVVPARVGLAGLAVGLVGWVVRSPPVLTAHPAGNGGPSVLLVTVDTWRADSRSGHDQALAPSVTPFLDGLAERGCNITPAYSTSPLTGPSHAAMHSGVHPIDLGILLNALPLPADIPWLAEELAADGYRTEAWVSSAMLDRDLGYDRGFARYDDDLDGLSELRATAVGFVLGPADVRSAFERDGPLTLDRFAAGGAVEGPLFAWVHVYDPHRPYEPTEASLAEIPPQLPLPAASDFDAHPVGPPPIRGSAGGQLAQLHGEMFGGTPPPVGAERDRRNHTAEAAAVRYLAEVRDTDALVARAFAIFEARTGSPPEVWAVVGDHGESLTEHHEIGSHQRHLYRANTEVPLLLSPGPCPEGPVSTVALADGLRARLDRGTPSWESPVVAAVMGPPHGRPGGPLVRKLSYREDTRALLVTLPSTGRTMEHYDLARDPHERFPLPANEAMVQAAGPWIEALQTGEVREPDAAMTEALEALGYVH